MKRNAYAAGPLNAKCLLPVLADFKYGDIDHNFGARLIKIVDELLCQQQFVWRTAADDGVLTGYTVDLEVAGEHVAERGLNVVQIILLPGIGKVEGLHGLLVELGPLGTVILGNKNGVRSYGPPECVRKCAHNAQGIKQRRIIQVHLDSFGGVFRVEEDVDAGGLADGLIHNL